MKRQIYLRRLFSRVLLCLLLLVPLVLAPVMSATAAAEKQQSETLPYYVSDVAGLLTSSQWQDLESAAEQISEQYQCGVYLVTIKDYREFGSYQSYWNFSQDFYTRYKLGLGEQRNGILLIMSMEERDYSLLAYGSDAHYAFTDYGKEVLENRFLDNFRNNDWYGGFKDYVNGCGELLKRAAAGEPLDVHHESSEGLNSGINTAIVVGVPLVTAFGVCEGMKRQMKPVRQQERADEYIVPGGINLSLKRDVFVNRTVTRTRIHSEPRVSGGGGGGGTTINSQGFSGHSGKF